MELDESDRVWKVCIKREGLRFPPIPVPATARSESSPTKFGAPAAAVLKMEAMARVMLNASLRPITSELKLQSVAPGD